LIYIIYDDPGVTAIINYLLTMMLCVPLTKADLLITSVACIWPIR